MRIGIDLGGTNIAVGLVDDEGRIVARDSRKTLPERGGAAIVADMAALCRAVCESCGLRLDEVDSIGIGSPGSIDSAAGVVVFAGNLGFKNFEICRLLADETKRPVFLGNDANVAALGEFHAGAGRDYDSMILITLGTGVGGGLIFDNKIFEGANGAAGEVGHMVIVENGESCTCGRRGCWEAYASATALIRMTQEEMDRCPESSMWTIAREAGKVNGRTAFTAGRNGDEPGLRVINRYLHYVMVGAANLINLFQPAALCIGGGISGEGTYLTDWLQPVLDEECFDVGDKRAKVCLAKLGNDAGIIGASLLGA